MNGEDTKLIFPSSKIDRERRENNRDNMKNMRANKIKQKMAILPNNEYAERSYS